MDERFRFKKFLILGSGPIAARAANVLWDRYKCPCVIIAQDRGSLPSNRKLQGAHLILSSKLSERTVVDALGSTPKEDAALFSIGSPWIIQSNILEMFGDAAFNLHPGTLPENRGASAVSWSILNGEIAPRATIHTLTTRIDEGEILASESLHFSKLPPTPEDYQSALLDVLDKLLSKLAVFFATHQDGPRSRLEYRATNYFPALSSERNGWIDWNWHGIEILRFIRAFSHPYNGASTLLRGHRVRILDAEFLPGASLHPFSRGIVTSRMTTWFDVAVEGGHLRVPSGSFTSSVDSHLPSEGDRVYTPRDRLDDALSWRRKNL